MQYTIQSIILSLTPVSGDRSFLLFLLPLVLPLLPLVVVVLVVLLPLVFAFLESRHAVAAEVLLLLVLPLTDMPGWRVRVK